MVLPNNFSGGSGGGSNWSGLSAGQFASKQERQLAHTLNGSITKVRGNWTHKAGAEMRVMLSNYRDFEEAAAEIASFNVIAFGYIAAAIAVLLGPIFIPFFIVPKMEWLFWGWFKALLQYAFYPVVANAYIFVFGQLLIHFVDSHPPPYDGATLAVLFLPLLFLLIAFTWGVLLIPSLVNSLFTGRSGESTGLAH